MLVDYFRLAFRNITHRRRRSWLTILGTLIGIMAVVSLISIGQGLQNSIQSEFERLGGDKVAVTPGGGFSARFSDTTVELTDDDLQTIRNTRGVEGTAGVIQGSIRVSYDDESKFLTITGMPTDESLELVKSFNNVQVSSGRFIKQTDRSNIVVGSDAVSEVYEDEVYLRSRLSIKGSSYSVVGIAESTGNPRIDRGIIVPREVARDVLNKPDSYDILISQISQGYDPGEVADDIEKNLRDSRDIEEGEEDFSVQTSEDLIRSFNNQLAIVRAVLLGIGSISLFVGGVGIMNTMYTSVTERTRDIGIMKAVGATKKQILTIFLIESGIIGMVGGVIGATVGIGISYIATAIITQQIGLVISPYIGVELVAGSLFFSFIVGMVSGVLPARKASKLKPVDALRYD